MNSNPILEQLANDITLFVSRSKGHKMGLTLMATRTGVSKKTLQRILKFENVPSGITLFKVYSFLLNANSETEVIEKCPSVIREALQKCIPQISGTNKNEAEIKISEILANNTVARELVTLLATGPLKKSEIFNYFGQYGLNLLADLVQKKIVLQMNEHDYKIGMIQNFLDKNYIFTTGLHIAKTYAKLSESDVLDQNCHSFYAEGVSKETYRKWLKIDTDAYQKKMELLADPRNLGPVRVYTFTSTDTLAFPKKKEDQ